MMPADFVRDYYRERLRQKGDGPQGADWRDGDAQDGRLSALMTHVDLCVGGTILDVGCGTGRLAELILRSRKPFDRYTGVDLVPEAVEIAREKHGESAAMTFLAGELGSVAGVYDYVVASGIFNVREGFDDEAWEGHIALVAAEMRKRCRRRVVFNALPGSCDRRDGRLYYLDAQKVLPLFGDDGFITTVHEGVNRFDVVVCQERRP